MLPIEDDGDDKKAGPNAEPNHSFGWLAREKPKRADA
jgi:hypothetical protein